MKKLLFLFAITVLTVNLVSAQGYNVGDKAADFRLKNVDGSYVSMSD